MKITGDNIAAAPLAAADSSQAAVKSEDFQSVLNNVLTAADDAKLKEACREFEAVFLRQLFDSMRATVPQSGLPDGGIATEIFTGMLDEAIAGEAAKGEGVGLAAALYENLRRKAGTK